MAWRLADMMKKLFGQGADANDDARRVKRDERGAREQQDKLDKQRADWEGMTRSN